MIALAVAWLTVALGTPVDETTLYSSEVSGPSGTATIVQTGPKKTKPSCASGLGPGTRSCIRKAAATPPRSCSGRATNELRLRRKRH
jgi:hypothetical protein